MIDEPLSITQAKKIGDFLGSALNTPGIEQIQVGPGAENGLAVQESRVNDSAQGDFLFVGKIAMAQLSEFLDQYTRLSAAKNETDRS